MVSRKRFACLGLTIATPLIGMSAEVVFVDSKAALVRAATAAKPGDVIRIAPGIYSGGIYLSGLAGTDTEPILIEGSDPRNPPWFSATEGGNSAIHLSGCSHVILRHLKVTGFPANGINADDGGDPGRPAVGLRFHDLAIEETGPQGNHDALKLSGLKGFEILRCAFRGWGGSAIDLVGCHDGVVSRSRFEGRPGFSQSNGVQMKGGSSEIRILQSTFRDAGERAINLGGSTGLPFFRPIDAAWEASDIEVAGNTFTGSLAPVAWVGIDGGHVHHNTIYRPEKWIGRILQENTDPRFGLCRNGRLEHNLIVFDRRVQSFINVGGNTAPDTFVFLGNAWYDLDDPGRGPTGLPALETDGVVGVNPELTDPGAGDFSVRSADARLRGVGAGAYRPEEP